MTFLQSTGLQCFKILTILVVTSALEPKEYTNSWAVHLPNADHEKASLVAKRHGMVNLGQVSSPDVIKLKSKTMRIFFGLCKHNNNNAE